MDTVEHLALVVDQRLGGVDVFGSLPPVGYRNVLPLFRPPKAITQVLPEALKMGNIIRLRNTSKAVSPFLAEFDKSGLLEVVFIHPCLSCGVQ